MMILEQAARDIEALGGRVEVCTPGDKELSPFLEERTYMMGLPDHGGPELVVNNKWVLYALPDANDEPGQFQLDFYVTPEADSTEQKPICVVKGSDLTIILRVISKRG